MPRPRRDPSAAPEQTTVTSFRLFDGDKELLQFIMEFLGTSSRSEAMRASLRAYAMHLESLQRRR